MSGSCQVGLGITSAPPSIPCALREAFPAGKPSQPLRSSPLEHGSAAAGGEFWESCGAVAAAGEWLRGALGLCGFAFMVLL